MRIQYTGGNVPADFLIRQGAQWNFYGDFCKKRTLFRGGSWDCRRGDALDYPRDRDIVPDPVGSGSCMLWKGRELYRTRKWFSGRTLDTYGGCGRCNTNVVGFWENGTGREGA